MKREILTDAFYRASESLGYEFFCGDEPAYPAAVDTFPAVWLHPLKLISQEGRNECRAAYHAAAVFLVLQDGSFTDQAKLWKTMETDSLAIFHQLPENAHVTRTFNFKCSANKKSFTRHGELSVTAEFDIEVFYYR